MSLASYLFKKIASRPLYTIIFIIIIFFFPLELIDYIIIIIINIGIAILNALLWLFVIMANGIVWAINTLLQGLETWLDTAEINIGDVPLLPTMDYFTQPWVTSETINFFGTTASLFTIILSLTGLSFPVWG